MVAGGGGEEGSMEARQLRLSKETKSTSQLNITRIPKKLQKRAEGLPFRTRKQSDFE